VTRTLCGVVEVPAASPLDAQDEVARAAVSGEAVGLLEEVQVLTRVVEGDEPRTGPEAGDMLDRSPSVRAVRVIHPTPETVPLASLRAVLEYLWDDEHANYRQSPGANHVFRSLGVLDDWLSALEREPAAAGEGSEGPGPGRMANAARAEAQQAVVEVSADQAYWGVCPYCLRNDGYLNLGRSHWFVCHADRVRWLVGENLFSTWRHDTAADWDANWERIGSYATCRPVLVHELPPVTRDDN
jgi:hypothetical protein